MKFSPFENVFKGDWEWSGAEGYFKYPKIGGLFDLIDVFVIFRSEHKTTFTTKWPGSV